MANQTLLQLPINNSPTTGAVFYIIDNNSNNYQTSLNAVANTIIENYNLAFSGNINASGLITTGQINPAYVVYITGAQTISGTKSFISAVFPSIFSGNQLIIGTNIINQQNTNSIILNNNNDGNLYLQSSNGGIILTTNNLPGTGINLNGYTYCNGPLYIYDSTGLQTGLQLAYFDGLNSKIGINDLQENISADFANRQLFSINNINGSSMTSIDFNNCYLISNNSYPSSFPCLNWSLGQISNISNGNLTIDWMACTAYDPNTNSTGINWIYRTLNDTGNLISVDWANRLLNDKNDVISVDWNGRSLYDQLGNLFWTWGPSSTFYPFQTSLVNPNNATITVANWSSGFLFDNTPFGAYHFTGASSVDWFNRKLYDTNTDAGVRQLITVPSIDWGNRWLLAGTSVGSPSYSGLISLDWNNRILSGNWSCISFLSSGSNPVYTTGNQSITGNKTFYAITPQIISGQGQMLDGGGFQSINWNNRNLFDTNGILSEDWQNRVLKDSLGNQSISWGFKNLYDINGNLSVDYGNRILTGLWNISGLNVSGKPVVIQNQLESTGTALQNQINNINISGGNTIVPSAPFNININWSSGFVFYSTLTGNSTNTVFNFSNQQDGQMIVVSVTNPSTNLYSGLWPLNVLWPSLAIPLQSTGATDIYTFVDITGQIYGNVVQGF